jgi:hypothetical protein
MLFFVRTLSIKSRMPDTNRCNGTTKNSATITATGISDTDGGKTCLVTDSMIMKRAMNRLSRQIPTGPMAPHHLRLKARAMNNSTTIRG